MFPQTSSFLKKYSFWRSVLTSNWITAYGFAIFILILMHLFFVRHPTLMDAGGFLNPPYEFVHQGRVVYPAYSASEVDRMVIHPPVYSWIAGILMKLGSSYYAALMIHVLFASAIAILAIVISGLSPIVKCGFITGLYVANFQFMQLYLCRSELALTLWWFAGLFILENARTRNWSSPLLALGSFVIAFSSSFHYHAWPGVFAIGVYSLACIIDRGPRKAMLNLAWVLMGFLAYLIPFAGYFLVPQWKAIIEIIRVVGATEPMSLKGIMTSFSKHVDDYMAIGRYLGNVAPLCYLFYPFLKLGIPSALIALPLFLLRKDTRTLAVAAAPLLLPMVFIISRKFYNIYYRPEFTLLFAALFIFIISGLKSIIRRKTSTILQPSAFTFLYGSVALVLALLFLVTTDRRIKSAFKGQRFLDEIRLERAVAKEIHETHPTVGGVGVLPWFTSGAAIYRDLVGNLIYPSDLAQIDVEALLNEMDAVVDNTVTSSITYNKQRKTLTSLYLDRMLHLRGFYSGRGEKMIFMSRRLPEVIKAFYWEGEKFYEFKSSTDGNKELLVFEVDSAELNKPLPQGAQMVLTLSLPTLPTGERTLLVILQEEETTDPIYSSWKLRDRIRGQVLPRDAISMVQSIRYQTEIVKQYHSLTSPLATKTQ